MTPERICRRRTKGWRLPPNTVCVTRPGKWGNPFRVGGWFKWRPDERPPQKHFRIAWTESDAPNAVGYTQIRDNPMAIQWFKETLTRNPEDLKELRGKNLACWCEIGHPCHAEVLLRVANSKIEKSD